MFYLYCEALSIYIFLNVLIHDNYEKDLRTPICLKVKKGRHLEGGTRRNQKHNGYWKTDKVFTYLYLHSDVSFPHLSNFYFGIKIWVHCFLKILSKLEISIGFKGSSNIYGKKSFVNRILKYKIAESWAKVVP